MEIRVGVQIKWKKYASKKIDNQVCYLILSDAEIAKVYYIYLLSSCLGTLKFFVIYWQTNFIIYLKSYNYKYLIRNLRTKSNKNA